MAPKRANPIEVPPAASSDEEEVTSSGEEEEEEEEEGFSSEGEEEEEPQTPLTQKNPPPKTPETATPSAANEDSEESGSESGSDTPKPNVKPIATKPMTIKAASSSKRPPESSQQEDKEAKRPKKKAPEEEGSVKKPAGGGEDAKKNLFQRLFSEEDEIALLKGMLDYSATKNGADPIADMNAFYDFVKKSVHTDVTKAQVMDKIRRLKKKFENNAGKGKGGEDPNFSKAHDFNAFKLSKKIWGKEGISGKVESSAAKSNGKSKGNNKSIIALKAAESVSSPNKKVVVDGGVKVDGEVTPISMEVDNKKGSNSPGSLFDKRFGVSSLQEEILKHGFDMVDAEKKAALEVRWRNLQIRELELFVERNEMVKNLAKSMLESYKSEDK